VLVHGEALSILFGYTVIEALQLGEGRTTNCATHGGRSPVLWLGAQGAILPPHVGETVLMDKQLIGYSIVLTVAWVSVVLLVMYWMS
jgi:hypothetical protein